MMLPKFVIALLGFSLVVFGTALIFLHWSLLVQLCLALIGPVIAVAGLVVMFYASIKKN